LKYVISLQKSKLIISQGCPRSLVLHYVIGRSYWRCIFSND